MKFQLISDVHGLFQHVHWCDEVDLILAAGDIDENLDDAVAFFKQRPRPCCVGRRQSRTLWWGYG